MAEKTDSRVADLLRGKCIVLGVTGSIAAYKAVALASELTKRGAFVDVIMTDAAGQFVTPLSFQAITHRPVNTEMFALLAELEIGHISLGKRADVLVVAPASANTIADLALGIADNLLLTTALATRAPIILAPAMEPLMYSHPATQANVELLRSRGVTILGPAEGRLASGKVGRGRMVEPAEIVAAIELLLYPGGSSSSRHKPVRSTDLAGRRVVVTAGPCHEPIDPVRFIGNRSSGKMGFAIAEAARDNGAHVVLIAGPTALPAPEGVEVIPFETASQLRQAVEVATLGADILVMAAAVADYRVAEPAQLKLKLKREHEGDITLRLVRNPDILAGIGADPRFANTFKVGFAAETNDLLANARAKLARKRAQMIVANDVTSPGSGFGTDTNQVTILDWLGGAVTLELLPKRQVAEALFDRVLALLPEFAAASKLEHGR